MDFSKEFEPFLLDFLAASRNDLHNIIQDMRRNLRLIMFENAASGFCNPYLRRVNGWAPCTDMNMYRLKGHLFVSPEVNPIRTDFKAIPHRKSWTTSQDMI
jgi:hypothetical protein